MDPALEVAPRPPERPLRVLDIGFGRGMNSAALLANAPGQVELLGFEPHPARLEPWPHRPPRGADFPWWGALPGSWRTARGRIEVRAEPVAAGLVAKDGRFDVVLLDLYSPAAAPQDWEDRLFEQLAAHAAPGAVLTTYTCARPVRDGLADRGWSVEVLRRPGVRDTLRALWMPSSASGGGRMQDEVRR